MMRRVLPGSHGAALFAVTLAWAFASAPVALAAELVIEAGAGFSSNTAADAASTAGGNNGATLGEQRLIAFQAAADLLGAELDSDVEVTVDASMTPDECSDYGAVLGSAAPQNYFFDPDLDLWYPSALADAVVGYDLLPSDADIVANFNSSIDSGCLGGTRWYYGLDGNPPADGIDFLAVVLHELAHGLGFASMMDQTNGRFLSGPGTGSEGAPDVYSALVFDVTEGRGWPDMSAAERATSARNVRNLVWNGTRVTAEASAHLAPGNPLVVVTPGVTGFSGAISETNFGPTALQQSAEGELLEVEDSCEIPNDVAGKVLLMRWNGCLGLVTAQSRGAVGALLEAGSDLTPPGDLNVTGTVEVSIPTLHISLEDANALSAALQNQSLSVAISASSESLVGAHESGRVLLNATDPASQGSSISHWDSLTRRTSSLATGNRDLLMEPAGEVSGEQLDLTIALLQDIGWAGQFCGDGTLQSGEACDDGEGNSDSAPDACRSNCTLPSCGDGVVDSAEQCDLGATNGGAGAACLSDCTLSACGDGNLDGGEECDEGEDNSDTLANACRSTCLGPSCGDAVVDDGEDCDLGASNGAAGAACSLTCRVPVCGDGNVDGSEECDAGSGNSDTDADACRSDCTSAACGDAVQDSGEQCDAGELNSDAAGAPCRADCTQPACGDFVVDAEEECDEGTLNGTTFSTCSLTCKVAGCGNGELEGEEECDEGSANSDTTADACRSTCQLARCGDGVVDTSEQCDDGNIVEGDGCTAACVRFPSAVVVEPDDMTGVLPDAGTTPPAAGSDDDASPVEPEADDAAQADDDTSAPPDDSSTTDTEPPPDDSTADDTTPATPTDDDGTAPVTEAPGDAELGMGGAPSVEPSSAGGSSSGCVCRVNPREPAGQAFSLSAALGLLLALRRRALPHQRARVQ